MRLCHIVPSLEQRHGGPSRSVWALAHASAELGTDTTLAAASDERWPLAPAPGDAAKVRLFPRRFPESLHRAPALRDFLRREQHEILHAHALWGLPLHYAADAARRHRRPLVISPRGMMNAWAYRHHRFRKQLAAWLVHPGAFATAAGWHATSREEADDIRALGFTQPICVAPNGVTLPAEPELAAARRTWLEICPPLAGRRVALFYSRFHQKKRVRELVETWLRRDRGDWFLLLVGVPEEYSPAEIDSWIAAAGGTGRAAAFSGEGHPAPYAVASLFVLPSHSENFGLAIAEALASGVPACVTNGTPWTGLHAHQAGWCVPWPDWPATLERALAEAPDLLASRGRLGRAWMETEFTWTQAARVLLDFYRALPRT